MVFRSALHELIEENQPAKIRIDSVETLCKAHPDICDSVLNTLRVSHDEKNYAIYSLPLIIGFRCRIQANHITFEPELQSTIGSQGSSISQEECQKIMTFFDILPLTIPCPEPIVTMPWPKWVWIAEDDAGMGGGGTIICFASEAKQMALDYLGEVDATVLKADSGEREFSPIPYGTIWGEENWSG